MISKCFRNIRSALSRYSSLRTKAWFWGQPVLLTSVVITALVLGVRQLGALEALELAAFDELVRLQAKADPDPRLLVVTVTDADIQKRREYPLSDQTIVQLLTKLEQYQPQAIGLDIYRDIPQGKGYNNLVKHLQGSDRLVVVCELPESQVKAGIAPPPGLAEDQVGFSDFVLDSDGVVRRNLLFVTPDPAFPCATPYSFSFQLARQYLAKTGIEPELTPEEHLKFGSTIFKPLKPNSGGYQHANTEGYQVLLNYRSRLQSIQQVTLTDVLTGRLKPEWVKDRIVLIGVTAPSVNDTFYTPYSTRLELNQKSPGVLIHAQMVSQILGSVLDHQALFWFWPEWAEALWIWSWSLAGGIVAWRIHSPLQLGLVGSITLVGLGAVCFVIFTQSGWIPSISAALALVATGGTVAAYSLYQARHDLKAIAPQNSEPEQTPAFLATVLEGSDIPLDRLPDLNLGSDTLLGGRYNIIQVLGSGGFGITYLAEDTQRPGNPHCVIKRLMPARSDTRFLGIARRLFQTEAEALENLGRHSHIPQLLAYFEQNREFYLVEEFVKGHALADELSAGTRLSEAQVVDLLKEILAILAFIHQHQVIHRDIKPHNIIRREQDNQLVLIDFGAVKQIQSVVSAEAEADLTVAIGTRGYAPPEQLAGQPGLSSDIYALGMIGIQALTGVLPHQLRQNSHTGAVLWRHLTRVREDLAEILDKMVRYHFNERYQSATEVLRDLNRFAQTPTDSHSH